MGRGLKTGSWLNNSSILYYNCQLKFISKDNRQILIKEKTNNEKNILTPNIGSY